MTTKLYLPAISGTVVPSKYCSIFLSAAISAILDEIRRAKVGVQATELTTVRLGRSVSHIKNVPACDE